MPACASVSTVVVPSALVTMTLKLAKPASPASSMPLWLVSNTSRSACMSLVAVGSQSVKTTWLSWLITPELVGS